MTPYADGGCLTIDGVARCHPFCVPGAPAQRSNGATCCLDDECMSGQCFGASPGRICADSIFLSPEDAGCGDGTDCATQGVACDRQTQRCSTVIAAVIGPPETCIIGPAATSCSFGGLNGPFCALPGTRNQQGSNPCCYDRTDAGTVISCLATGTCYCLPQDDAGFSPCGAYQGTSCPF